LFWEASYSHKVHVNAASRRGSKKEERFLYTFTQYTPINRPKTGQDELTGHEGTLFQNLVLYLIDVLGMKKGQQSHSKTLTSLS